MNKDKVITILGLVTGLATLAHANGITIGHFGSTDFLSLIQAMGTTALGWAAGKDLTK